MQGRNHVLCRRFISRTLLHVVGNAKFAPGPARAPQETKHAMSDRESREELALYHAPLTNTCPFHNQDSVGTCCTLSPAQ